MGGQRHEGWKTILAVAMAGTVIAAAGAVLVDPGTAGQSETPPATAPPPVPSAAQQTLPAPLAEGPAPDLDLVFTAQVTGWIEPCG